MNLHRQKHSFTNLILTKQATALSIAPLVSEYHNFYEVIVFSFYRKKIQANVSATFPIIFYYLFRFVRMITSIIRNVVLAINYFRFAKNQFVFQRCSALFDRAEQKIESLRWSSNKIQRKITGSYVPNSETKGIGPSRRCTVP